MRYALSMLVALSGCGLSHGFGTDAGSVDDGAADAPITDDSSCPFIAGYRTCGDLCPTHRYRCPEGTSCDLQLNGCFPLRDHGVYEGADGCALSPEPGSDLGSLTYCPSAEICAAYPDEIGGWGGACVSDDYCRAVTDYPFDAHCMYSDFTDFVDGPPDGTGCPADAAHPRSPLCGRGCGVDRCPSTLALRERSGDPDVGCIGLSEERGVGVCVFGGLSPCEQGHQVTFDSVNDECQRPAWAGAGAPCACLVMRNEDGSTWTRGWYAVEQSCRLYASLYPDAYACVDRDWTVLE